MHRYDVIRFSPRLQFDFPSRTIAGFVLIDVTTPQLTLDQLDFRFTHALTLDSVWADAGFSAAVTSEGSDSIQVLLVPALQPGDTVTIGLAYHGAPGTVDPWGGFRWAAATSWQPEIAFSMGDGIYINPPPANYSWIPSYADPTDKALWDAWFRVPDGKTVTSNGILLDTLNHGDGTTTWHYRLDQPVSTYLQFVSASTYQIQVQRVSGPRIENFVYPSRATQALTHFANVPAVLDSFVARFGPYPFDRMGFNMTRNGDMEHATCVSHFDQVVAANHTYDWLLFHELSHMWWGNWVTCGDWRDLWLNEGFATYCEALGKEALGGFPAYMSYVTTNLFPSAIGANDSYSIYDPDYYWGATVYEKGGCVMHMFRMLLGDAAFFAALREFGATHAFGNAVTPDWQATLEQHYGASLDWFFQPWVYGTRFPRYRAVLDYGDQIVLRIDQIQTTDTRFRMPVDIRLMTSAGDTVEFTVWNEAVESQSFTLVPNDTLNLPAQPASVQLDPYNKILKTVIYQILDAGPSVVDPPVKFALTSVHPNPFNSAAVVEFDLPQASSVRLRAFNLIGREVKRADLGAMSAGSHSVAFSGDDLASGVYLISVESALGTSCAKALLLK